MRGGFEEGTWYRERRIYSEGGSIVLGTVGGCYFQQSKQCSLLACSEQASNSTDEESDLNKGT